MATSPRHRPKLVAAATAPAQEAPRRRSQVNLSDLAYERLEELLICCELKPGRFLATHELQALVCLLYTSPSPRDGLLSRMPSSA